MATAPRKPAPQQGAAAAAPPAITPSKVASKAAQAAKGAVSKAGRAAGGAAKQAQAAAQVAAQGAAQMTKAAAAKAAVPVAMLAQKLGGGPPAVEAASKPLLPADAAEKGMSASKLTEESELNFEEVEREPPNRTLICTSFMVYVLFITTCVVFAEYSFKNYDLDPADIGTHAPPLGTAKDDTTKAPPVHRRLPIKRHRNGSLDRTTVETEPEFDWDDLRLGEVLSAEYVPEVLSSRLQRVQVNGSAPRPIQHAPALRNGEEDYIPEILENE